MQVDFYQLAGTPTEQVIATLAEKVLEADGRLLIVAEDEAQLVSLDRQLWDQGATSFLPHGVAGGAEDARQPILLSTSPDAPKQERNLTGAVTKMMEDAGLRVVASKRIRMTRDRAEGFYAVHRERPFFNDLCTFMTSGPVVVQVLEGENAVLRNREVMGATNPEQAA